ncbi:DapH/DapD/GlmU-related protein [Vibrio scophthalmi]|uniref:Serine O-acetyltransferase n=1 Tax=Vibrio scophthalmi TaxID=45658 RepID=A0A1C7FCT0_9VIBR|nr:serine acetyltransferase [Vibrio scophthalmi]ANU37722.1 Serine O-acetyltransferase [Vibrio scophthalmi]
MELKRLFILLIKWMATSNPIKKFSLEIQLMRWGKVNSRPIRKYFQRRIFYKYNCDISHSADIHPSVIFPHPTGVVIGSNAVVEEGCFIYQQVTIGGNFESDNSMAHVKKDTHLGTGAKIIGGIEIGSNCRVGANAVITKNLQANSLAVGVNKVIGTR